MNKLAWKTQKHKFSATLCDDFSISFTLGMLLTDATQVLANLSVHKLVCRRNLPSPTTICEAAL